MLRSNSIFDSHLTIDFSNREEYFLDEESDITLVPLLYFLALYPPHTCRCWPPMNDSYQQGALSELF
jgi:hypothetical protein